MEHPVLIYIPAVDELEIKVQEVTRYLGYGGNRAEGEDLKLIEKKIAEVKKIMAPKACYARYGFENDEESCVLTFPYGATKSEVLSRHLSGCSEVFIFAATIGAVFDFFAGTSRRAPRWWQEHSLEWLYRLCMEPGRMWRRYVLGNPLFLYHVMREKLTGNP